jgi:uncharacterized protein YecT (DUF1311 family)
MRVLLITAIAFAGVSSGTAADYGASNQVEPGRTASSECTEGTPREVDRCVRHFYKAAMDRLAVLYMKHIDGLTDEPTITRFKSAQDAWQRAVALDCGYHASVLAGRGLARETLEIGCLEEHTQARIEKLEQYVGCTIQPCVE